MALSKNRAKTLLMLIMGMLLIIMMSGKAFADDSNLVINGDVLVKCTSDVTEVVVPDGIKVIDRNAFNGCTSLKSVVLPKGLTTIGEAAFYNCVSLQSIELPDGLQTIGKDAFDLCTSLKTVIIPDSVTSIDKFAFRFCTSLTELKLSSSLKIVPEGIASFCSSLQRVIIPEGVKEIQDDAFFTCGKLVYVGLPSTLERIYPFAFNSCTSLTTISLPKSLKAVGTCAFYNCPELTTVYYAGSKAQWNNVIVRQEPDPIKGNIENGNNQLVKAKFTYNKSTFYFNDVMAGQYYASHIKYLFDRKAMTGLNAGTFGTDVIVDRATAVTILYKMEGQPAVSSSYAPFSDVALKQWYTKACAWAKETGISTGYTDGRFGYNDKLTRQDFLTFLYRYAQKYKKFDVTVENADAYKVKKDASTVLSYATKAVNWGVSLGLVGKGTDYINPLGTLTRQDAATMVSRFMQHYEK